MNGKKTMQYCRRCWTCCYAPGGYPWYNPQGAKLWCGVGQRMVLRESGEDCPEWCLMRNPQKCAEKPIRTGLTPMGSDDEL